MMVDTEMLSGDVAIVTGAAQGNGRAIAIGLAAYGAKVICGDVDAAGAEETAAMIRDNGGEALAVVSDVRDRQSCDHIVSEAERAYGGLSILINNAGVLPRGDIETPDFDERWDWAFDVNVNGVKNMTLAALEPLKKTRGRIVNMGSIQSLVAVPNSAAYSATKGAIAQLTKALALELTAHDIRVNAIAPGIIATEMSAVTRSEPERLAKFLTHVPMGRVGQPGELVGPVVFLVSPMSSYVTGIVLPIDGGYVAM